MGLVGTPKTSAYSASKGAIVQLSKAMSNEWARYGIDVNAIAPGCIRTEAIAGLVSNPQRAPLILARIPAGRSGEPEDLKRTAVFLAQAASDFVNGVILPVDEGYLAI